MKSFIFVLTIFCGISLYAKTPQKRLTQSEETPISQPVNSFDKKLEAVGGIRINNSNLSGINGVTKFGLQGGVYYYHPLANQFSIRTGGLLSYKNAEVQTASSKIGLSRWLLEVPVHLYLEGLPVVSPFLGVNLDLRLTSSCDQSVCATEGDKSFILQMVLGADFQIDKYKVGIMFEPETEYWSFGGASWKQSAFVITFMYPLN